MLRLETEWTDSERALFHKAKDLQTYFFAVKFQPGSRSFVVEGVHGSIASAYEQAKANREQGLKILCGHLETRNSPQSKSKIRVCQTI